MTREKAIKQLVESADWLLDFLQNYPPTGSDGRTVMLDCEVARDEIAESIEVIRSTKPRRKRRRKAAKR